MEPLLSRPNPDSTLWDVASITKVVSTTSAAMRLVDRESWTSTRLCAGTAAVLRWPEEPCHGAHVVGSHQRPQELRAFLHQGARSRARAIDLLYAQPLLRVPGDSAEYSDLNALFLGLILEKVSGLPLDRLARREVFGPLGMSQTMYKPPRSPNGASCRAASGAGNRCRAT